MSDALSMQEETMARSVGWKIPEPDYEWTRNQVEEPLRRVRFDDIVRAVSTRVAGAGLVIADADRFIKRSVTALLAGHLIIKGPPGTGKTTFVQILGDAFEAELRITTATAEWSTYDVVGGLRPSADGGLEPVLGAVASAALRCARRVELTAGGLNPAEPQATWLLIDELNRADIDKAIGSLYTVLSSVSADHLRAVPLELWFEKPGRDRIWMPSRFRIIGTMNDVDTSYVNAFSQGLTRRFQFVTLGVSTDLQDQRNEVASTLDQALSWLERQRGVSYDVSAVSLAQGDAIELLQDLVGFVRSSGEIMWPLGTAQVLSIWRTVLVAREDLSQPVPTNDLDEAIADLVVPQAGALDENALLSLKKWMGARNLLNSERAVGHLLNTSSTY